MRVAYICCDAGVPVFGHKGCSVHVQEVIRGLLARGVDVELFACRTGGAPPPDLASLVVHELPCPRGRDRATREQMALTLNAELGRILRSTGRFDMIYERHALFSCAAMEHARDEGVPGLLEINAPLLEEQRRYRELVHDDDAERIVARAFAAASACLCVSDGVADYVRRHPARPTRVQTVPNGVSPDRFAPDHPAALPAPGRLTVGFVGSLRPWHGVETLVEAFAGIRASGRPLRLLLVGDGPRREDLEALVARLGLGNATVFTGAVGPDGVPALLTSMDIAVAPYPDLDGFYFSPLKVYEYMAAGRAVVAAAIGQLNDVIDHGVDGLLYPAGDTEALRESIIQLADDPRLRARIGHAARAKAVSAHAWTSVADTILETAGLGAAGRCDASRALPGRVR